MCPHLTILRFPPLPSCRTSETYIATLQTHGRRSSVSYISRYAQCRRALRISRSFVSWPSADRIRSSHVLVSRYTSHVHLTLTLRFQGYHPWFTHWFTLKDTPPSKEEHYSALFLGSATPSADHPHMTAFSELLPHLPNPTPLKEILATLRGNLAAFPSAMLGEVGIDRSFRVARSYTEDPRVLSPFTVPIAHQLAVLNAQLEVAVELRRNISMHSVKAQQLTVDLLASSRKRWGAQWDALSVDLHSCGLSPQTWVQLEVLYQFS